MAERRIRFEPKEVEAWLKEADKSRARWGSGLDAGALAADLCALKFDDRFDSHRAAVHEGKQIAERLRKDAKAFTDRTLPKETHDMLIVGTARALGGDLDKAYGFPTLLKKIADAIENAVTTSQRLDTRVDMARVNYGCVAKTLERHTRKPAIIREEGPDATFVRNVIERAGLKPWRPTAWRRYAEEWAAIESAKKLMPFYIDPRSAGRYLDSAEVRDATTLVPVPFFADPQTGWVSREWIDLRTGCVINRHKKKA